MTKKNKFSISEGMLNGISKNTEKVSLLDAKQNFKFDYIDINNIKINSKNFYPIESINELAKDISINGLNHNLVVRPIDDGNYEIISGERRYTALKSLVDNNEKKYSQVPCKIVDLEDLDSEIILIQANAQTRELSDADKLKQIERLRELYKEKKAQGGKIGDIRGLISKDVGLSPGQVAKYSSISNNLIPELRELLDKGNLTMSNATEFASLSIENQKAILSIVNNEVNISKNEASEIKKEFKKIENEKKELLEKEEAYLNEIEAIKKKNNEKADNIHEEIEKVKKELLEDSNKDKQDLINKLEKLKNDKSELAEANKNLEDKIKKADESINVDIDNRVNEKVEEIKLKFEKENKKLKEKLNNEKNVSQDTSLNQELKIRLGNTRLEISKIAGLMANNKIMDKDTLDLVDRFENELRFLNEQILLYKNEEKIK